jgi:hypothetical protein
MFIHEIYDDDDEGHGHNDNSGEYYTFFHQKRTTNV